MSTLTLRRVSVAAIVCAALATPAMAQQGRPEPGPGDHHQRMGNHWQHHRGFHHGFHHRRGGMMWARFGDLRLMGMMPMRPGVHFRFVEGRIAFLKAELKITDAQAKQWDAFAAALRENASKLTDAYKMPDRDARAKMGPAERIDWYEKALSARLDAVKRTQAALGPLYTALNDDQKKTFNRLVPTGGMREHMRHGMRHHMHQRMEHHGTGKEQPKTP
jgi:hypothetical protein